MADYIIDIWKDGELVQSVAGKWTDDEAPPRHPLLSRLLPRRSRAALARTRRRRRRRDTHRGNLRARRPGRRDHDFVVIFSASAIIGTTNELTRSGWLPARGQACFAPPAHSSQNIMMIFSAPAGAASIPPAGGRCLGALPLGAHQAASTQKDRRGFARRARQTALLFGSLRSRLTLAHPALGEGQGCICRCNP